MTPKPTSQCHQAPVTVEATESVEEKVRDTFWSLEQIVAGDVISEDLLASLDHQQTQHLEELINIAITQATTQAKEECIESVENVKILNPDTKQMLWYNKGAEGALKALSPKELLDKE